MIDDLRCMKGKLEHEIANFRLRIQTQTKANGRLERGAETEPDSLVALAESQAACAMLILEWDSLLEAVH